MSVEATSPAASAAWRGRLRAERASRTALTASAGLSLLVVFLVVLFLGIRAWFGVVHIGLDNFFFSFSWDPEGAYHHDANLHPLPTFGALTPIAGSLIAVLLALLVAVPVAMALAIVIAETNKYIGDRILRPAIELFLGIPSVVYGFLGLTVLVPRLAPLAPAGRNGEGFAAAAIVLAVMIIPTVASLAADALMGLPSSIKEASYALGATQWQTIRRVLLPAARRGITSGIVLGFARAMGEALAVALVIGGVPQPPDLAHGAKFLFEPGMTMTTTITDGISELGFSPKAEAARYMLAMVLLIITFLCVTAIRASQREESGSGEPEVTGARHL
jgi:phosphate transport system permease protein